MPDTAEADAIPMKFGCNAYCFPHDGIRENAAAVAEAGYDGIEPKLDPESLEDPEAIDTVRRAAETYDLTIPSVTGGDFWGSPLSSTDESTRREGLRQGRKLIEVASTLGAETVLVVPGVVDEETRYDRAYENALEGVRELAATADDHGVALGVENVWNGMLYSPLEFREFVDAAAEAGPVGAYFDVGNVARFGYPVQWIHILGDRIEAVHVKGYDEEVDTIDGFTYPLAGTINWPSVVEALDDIGYDRWIAPEVPPYDSYPERTLSSVREDLGTVFDST